MAFINKYLLQNNIASLSDDEMNTITGFDKNKRLVHPIVNGKPRDLKSKHYPWHIEF